MTQRDLEAFAEVSGDFNPMHLDPQFAATTRYGRQIAQGMLTLSYISAVLGTRLPGPGAIYLSQRADFRAPVFLGDEITATAIVTAYRPEKAILTLRTECTNQEGVLVLEGEAVCLVSDVPMQEDGQPLAATA